jgi:serine/threonine protein kinase
MEYCDGGDLRKVFDKFMGKSWRKRIPEDQMMRWLYQICLALFYLHNSEFNESMGLAHRDLKPENIFLMIDFSIDGGFLRLSIKLGDLGNAKAQFTDLSLNGNTLGGTPAY